MVNLDPAAEEFGYDVSFDVRDLITVADVMEELNLGPNGALVYCMEYLLDNLDWIQVCELIWNTFMLHIWPNKLPKVKLNMFPLSG